MTTTEEVTWGRLDVRPPQGVRARVEQDAPGPRITVTVYTASGQARIATLTRQDLNQLIAQAGEALVMLDRYDQRNRDG